MYTPLRINNTPPLHEFIVALELVPLEALELVPLGAWLHSIL